MSLAIRGVAVFDLDGTITRQDTYRALLLRSLPGRLKQARVGRLLALPAAIALHVAGFRDNAWLKQQFLEAFLGGVRRQTLGMLCDGFVRDVLAQGLRPGARVAIERHRVAGDYLILATASFDFYVGDLARALGFDEVVCTESSWSGEYLRSDLPSGNCHGRRKRLRLETALARVPFEGQLTVYTDSYVDLPILELAARPVAVNPDRRLAAIASRRGYGIEDWGR